MLQLADGAIREVPSDIPIDSISFGAATQTYQPSFGGSLTVGCIQTTNYLPYTTWYGYPVYVCSDKTAKAIEVLKALQAEKLLKCDSVPRFIALVEKIAGLL